MMHNFATLKISFYILQSSAKRTMQEHITHQLLFRQKSVIKTGVRMFRSLHSISFKISTVDDQI